MAGKMIEPLTPPDCDLRGLPFMPLDVVRLLDSDLFALATGEEFKAALALWCKAWLQIPAASLPDEDRVLAHLSGAGSRWKRVRDMALRGWLKGTDGRFYHPVIAEKACDAWEQRAEWRERQSNKTERQQRWRERVKTLSGELRSLGVTPPAGASLAALEALLVDARASTSPSTVDAAKTALRGTGTIPLSNDNGGSTEIDIGKTLFDQGVLLLTSKGKTEVQARALIAKWQRDFTDAPVLEAINHCRNATDPVSAIRDRLGKTKAKAEYNGI